MDMKMERKGGERYIFKNNVLWAENGENAAQKINICGASASNITLPGVNLQLCLSIPIDTQKIMSLWMFLRCIFAHVCGRDDSLELIMFVSCFHKQSLVEKPSWQSKKPKDATLFPHNVLQYD